VSTNRKQRDVSPEEYLARERSAEIKSEYVDGELVAMSYILLNPIPFRVSSPPRRCS
jgi:Uma2 family endonuclease